MFTSWGMESAKKYTEYQLADILAQLEDNDKYGTILRAKGIVDSGLGYWLHFDYVPGEGEIREGSSAVTGRFCVIGSGINEAALKELFNS